MHMSISRLLARLFGVALVAGLLPLLSVAPAQAAAVGEAEPNNSTSKAQRVDLGTTIEAGFRTSGDCDNNFYDCDVYRFSTSSQGQLELDLRFSDTLGTEGSFSLTVLNAEGTAIHSVSIGASDYDGSRLRSLAMFVDEGVFYLSLKARVSGFSSGYIWSGQPYVLGATVTPGVVETEPNSKTASADVIALGRSIAGSTLRGDCDNGFYDCDYYRLPLAAATRVAVDFQFACDLGTEKFYTVSVYDTSGGRLTSRDVTGADCKGATLRSDAVTAPAGNLYVRVYSRTGGATTGLRYTVTVYGVFAASNPTIAGQVKVGQQLTAAATGWTPAPAKLSFQWLRDGKVITGATTKTYVPTLADAGRKISVRSTGTKPAYLTASRTSQAHLVPLLALQTAIPTVTGAATFGKTLTAKVGSWGPVGVKLAYQWLRDGRAIQGATKATYTLVAADVKHAVSVKVTGSKTGYATTSKTSKATGAVAPATFAKTPKPAISGTAKVKKTLRAKPGTWVPSGAKLSYQWYRNGKKISGAKQVSYKLVKADKGKKITVKVTGKKPGYTTVSKTSKATKRVK